MIPVEPLHKTVPHGFTAYLVIYALGWVLTGEDTRVANTLTPMAFNLLTAARLGAAWRDDTPTNVPANTLLYFWPWRRFERVEESRRQRGAAPTRAATGCNPTHSGVPAELAAQAA